MVEVEFVDNAAHAAVAPDDAINALDALIASYENIGHLRQQIRSDARIHCIITKGGEALNIIPALAAGMFGAHAKDNEYLDELIQELLACRKAGAQANGASFSYEIAHLRYAAFRSNSAIEQAFNENLAALDIPITREEGQERPASTNIGNISHALPTIQPVLAITDGAAPHTSEFLAAAVGERGNLGMLNGAEALRRWRSLP